MGIFFKVFARKHAILMFWINFKGGNQKNKIEGCRHESRRQPSTFSCHLPSGDRIFFWVVAVSHGDDHQLFCLAFFWRQEKS